MPRMRAQGSHPDRLFSICYLPVNLLTMVLLVYFIDRVNMHARIVGGLLIFFISVLAMPIVSRRLCLLQIRAE